MSGGKAFIIVGGTGMGKSTFTKNALSQVHVNSRLVFDNNMEYGSLYPFPFNPDFEAFAKKAAKVKNAFIVFEEATIFLKRQGLSEYTMRTLVEKRHRNNIIFFVFHSIRLIPLDIVDLCNYLVIHKTVNDSVDMVEKKFNNPTVTEAFLRIKNSPLLFNPQANKHYSPHEIVMLQ